MIFWGSAGVLMLRCPLPPALEAGLPNDGIGLLEGGAGAKNESETIGSREFTGSLPAVSLQTVLLIIFPKSAWA